MIMLLVQVCYIMFVFTVWVEGYSAVLYCVPAHIPYSVAVFRYQ